MSNPIADTAEYFARWKQFSRDSQDPQDDEGNATSHRVSTDLESTVREVNNNDSNISDNRSQWLRVLNRLSFLNPLESNTTETDFSDDDSIVDRDTFELMRSAARQQRPTPASRHQSLAAAASRHHSINVSTSAGGAIRGRDDNEEDLNQLLEQEEEEKLPSAYDLENDHIDPLTDDHGDGESNYFTRPFFPDRAFTRQPITTTPTTSRSNRHQQEEDDAVRVKDKWDRTLDKLKLIANLQSTTPPPVPVHSNSGPSHTLATYYPPAFDPIFAAFAKDEYGRKLVIFLCNFLCVCVTNILFCVSATYIVTMHICKVRFPFKKKKQD